MERLEPRDTASDPFLSSRDASPGTYKESRESWWSRIGTLRRGHRGDGSRPGWKPVSLSRPILAAIIALTLLIAAAIETLAQRSRALGGLALSPSLDEMPAYAKFSYLYVPTIVAVIYSLIWSWVDLDVKRMQPWFELSKPEGATAANSLFLDYPYDFVAAVPFKAARRRHWPVFLGGTTMVIVFWLITPLQSAILGTAVIARSEPVVLGNRSQLLPLADQAKLLDTQILSTGYAVGWLGQAYPPFMTAKYAPLPFYVEDDPAPTKSQTNWTASTTVLSTELDCWPAEVSRNGASNSSRFDFLNGQGCNITMLYSETRNYTMSYISPFWHYTTEFDDVDCPKTPDSKHQFLAIWTRTIEGDADKSADYDITGLYCQPSYYKQEAMVTVGADGLKPNEKSVEYLSPRQPLSDAEFNTTAFEYLLATGLGSTPETKDYPFEKVIDQNTRLGIDSSGTSVSNMVGFALAGKNLTIEECSDPELLEDLFHDGHQYIFSLAVDKLLTNNTSVGNETATSDFNLTGIVVSRVFSAVVEGLLLLVAVFAGILCWLCHSYPCNLSANPSSVGRLIDVFRASPALVESFHMVDDADDKTLLREFENDRFRLSRDGSHGSAQLLVERAEARTVEYASQLSKNSLRPRKGYYDPVRPLALRLQSGLLLIAVLCAAIAGLSYLKNTETVNRGLKRPTDNFEVLQLIENYIPTMFATLIEPFWVLLNRLLCVLQPFKDLWAGKGKPSTTVDSTYTSIPPQLVIWRAIKSRHYLLSLVCAVALLANLLAVGLGALFNEDTMTAAYSESFRPQVGATFNNESAYGFAGSLNEQSQTGAYVDHLNVAMANMSSGTPLPPWVSREYFFQPYDRASSDGGTGRDTYKMNTRGYGTYANCTAVPAYTLTSDAEDDPNWTTEKTLCGNFIIIAAGKIKTPGGPTRIPNGPCAVDYSSALDMLPWAECQKVLTVGWGRMPQGQNYSSPKTVGFAVCNPVFETAMFDVTVDASGHVVSYNRTSDIESTLDYTGAKNHTELLLAASTHLLDAGSGVVWHNDTQSRNWMNHLLVLNTGDRSIIDPSQPVPNPEDLVPAVEDVYRRVFAILLGLNMKIFDKGDPDKSITATVFTEETRIFMDDPAFIITMTVLVINVIAALLFYFRGVVFILPRLPTTIGSVLVYVATSRLVKSPNSTGAPGASRTYSFGRYIGLDGMTHIGIETDPHVVPVNPSSLQEKSVGLNSLPMSNMWRRKGSVRRGSWL